jgi:hypothetical protein
VRSSPFRISWHGIRASPMNLHTNGFESNCGWPFGLSRRLHLMRRAIEQAKPACRSSEQIKMLKPVGMIKQRVGVLRDVAMFGNEMKCSKLPGGNAFTTLANANRLPMFMFCISPYRTLSQAA